LLISARVVAINSCEDEINLRVYGWKNKYVLTHLKEGVEIDLKLI
jgi:hypothetical protein